MPRASAETPIHALQKQSADDRPQAVDQRRHGLHAELLAHQKHRAKDTAGKEKQLRRKQNAGQVNAECGLFRAQSR